MSRLTITLSNDMHRAVKEAAARQGRSIASIIEESLKFRGLLPRADASKLVAEARARSTLSEDQATQLAIDETRLHRSS